MMNVYHYIEQNRNRHFKWGTFDCCQFTGRCVEILTGRNILDDFATYDSEKSAMHELNRHGGFEGIMRKYGFNNIKVSVLVIFLPLSARKGLFT